MALLVVTDDSSDAHAEPGHPERPERRHAAVAGAKAWHGDVRFVAAEAADEQALQLVHSPSHLAHVAAVCAEGARFDADTYATPTSEAAARRAAGGALQAARSALAGTPALSLCRPPGHHAEPERAMGFCLYNNVAIAAAALAREGSRVSILDLDVHHGNGTQAAFFDRTDIQYVSLHQYPHYPMTGRTEETGAGATVNLPLPSGTGHAGWLEVYDHAVVPLVDRFGPDVILISLGLDAHVRDPLASLRLVAQTYHAAIERVRSVTPRIAVVLEGGYDLDALRDGVHNVCAALAGESAAVEEAVPDGVRPWGQLERPFRAAHGATLDAA